MRTIQATLFAAGCSMFILMLGTDAMGGSVNLALTSTVINSSGTYAGLPNFPATNVIDGKGVDNVNLGGMAQDIFGDNTPGSASYWLTQDNQGANSFFTLDLGQSSRIDAFRIADTRNTNYGDRGTLAFSILASNSIDASNNLVSPVTLISDQAIAQPTNPNDIRFQGYSSPSSNTFGSYRYVEFLTLQAVNGTFGSGGNGGLNEFQVIQSPEPSTFVLGGVGLVGLCAAARRRKAK